MLFSSLIASLVLGALSVGASSPTRTSKRWNNFITVENGEFKKNGEPFKFIGTNAYWLSSLNSDADINNTLTSIKNNGIKVVRTWAFNDVTEIPVNGTWFQLIKDGKTQINTGPNGLQRLDKVVEFAEKLDLHLILSLTNNWNPLPLLDNTTSPKVDGKHRRDVTVGTGNNLPRNFLSNDFGGMDAYVREFGKCNQHDLFFSDENIKNIFKNYTNQVVKRYVNSPAIFAWELANDARCNSSIEDSGTCTTNLVTSWHADVSSHVASVDPNHLVSAGVHGFMCMDCPKLFPLAPKPSTSPLPGHKKRRIQPLTTERLLRERTERRKKTRDLVKRQMLKEGNGLRIRGRWIAERQQNPQDAGLGSAFDGSSGVDSQDILNIPNIGFASFQYFPDQDEYGKPDPNLPQFNNTLNEGVNWIQMQSQLAQLVGKPTVMTGFGLVTQDNSGFFVPFNGTQAPFNSTGAAVSGGISGLPFAVRAGTDPTGTSNAQQDTAYTQWITAASGSGVNGAMQYQWGQNNLTPAPGTTIQPNTAASGVSPNTGTTGTSPNDGYQSSPTGADGVNGVLNSLTALFG